jgi:hypothetical protein
MPAGNAQRILVIRHFMVISGIIAPSGNASRQREMLNNLDDKVYRSEIIGARNNHDRSWLLTLKNCFPAGRAGVVVFPSLNRMSIQRGIP